MKTRNNNLGMTMEILGKARYRFKHGANVGVLFLGLLIACPVGGMASVDTEVQKNIDTLIQTNSCTGCNLTGADLTRLDLSSADLRDADLSSALFNLADLSEANLSGTVLRGAQFGGADLAGADLRGADLRGADLTGAYTAGAHMDGSLVNRQELDGDTTTTVFEKVYIPDDQNSKDTPDKQEVEIAKSQTPEATLVSQESAEVQNTEVSGPGADLMEQAPPVKTVSPVGHLTLVASAEPSNTPSAEATVQATVPEKDTEPEKMKHDVTELLAEPEIKSKEKSDYAELQDAKKSVPEKPIKKEQIADQVTAKSDAPEIEDSISTSSNVVVAKEDNVSVTPVEIQPEKTEVAEKSESPMVKDDREGTVDDKLTAVASGPVAGPSPAVILEKDIEETPEIYAEAETAQPPEQSQEDAEVEQTPQADTSILLAKLLDDNKCYECDLSGVDLSGKNLDEADLEGSDLSHANLEGVDLSEANLKGVSFRNANLKNADLREADLYKADFSGADLTGADLKGALLDETKFTGALGLDVNMMVQ